MRESSLCSFARGPNTPMRVFTNTRAHAYSLTRRVSALVLGIELIPRGKKSRALRLDEALTFANYSGYGGEYSPRALLIPGEQATGFLHEVFNDSLPLSLSLPITLFLPRQPRGMINFPRTWESRISKNEEDFTSVALSFVVRSH